MIIVHPGNDQFPKGIVFLAQSKGSKEGSGQGDVSDSGEGEDDFVFSISKEEYLNLLFEDLALPNLEKNQLDKLIQYKTTRAGYCAEGNPSNIDIVKSLQGSIARRIAMTASNKRRQLKELEEALIVMEAAPEIDAKAIKRLKKR